MSLCKSCGILRRFVNTAASNSKPIGLRRFLNTAASNSKPILDGSQQARQAQFYDPKRFFYWLTLDVIVCTAIATPVFTFLNESKLRSREEAVARELDRAWYKEFGLDSEGVKDEMRHIKALLIKENLVYVLKDIHEAQLKEQRER